MAEHPLQAFIKTSMEQLKETVNVSTTIGEPVAAPDGSVIIPVCKVNFGFAAGGSDFGQSLQESSRAGMPFGGGTGGGVSITPLAFLIIGKTGVTTVSLENGSNTFNKILDLAPHLLDKLQTMMNQYKQDPETFNEV